MEPLEGNEQRLEFDDPEHHSNSEAPEGSGAKLLVMFFGAAVVCAIFFGLGYRMGRSSASDNATTVVQEAKPVAAGVPKPSAMELPPQVQDGRPSSMAAKGKPAAAANESAENSKPPSPAPVAAHPSGNFAVQVAAVTREEDADALVNALRGKSYPVFVVSSQPGDKFFHVQVGPFPTLADAEAMRSRLAADGYNPILKK